MDNDSDVSVGAVIPTFSCQATSNKIINSSDFKNRGLVLFFYPRDNTPGCTVENKDFALLCSEFEALDIVILGVSRDRLVTHKNFKAKHNLPFELISDENEELCNLFNVMRNKVLYGKKVRGIERSTFLFDKNQILRHEWRKVKVDNHAANVLSVAKDVLL